MSLSQFLITHAYRAVAFFLRKIPFNPLSLQLLHIYTFFDVCGNTQVDRKC